MRGSQIVLSWVVIWSLPWPPKLRPPGTTVINKKFLQSQKENFLFSQTFKVQLRNNRLFFRLEELFINESGSRRPQLWRPGEPPVHNPTQKYLTSPHSLGMNYHI